MFTSLADGGSGVLGLAAAGTEAGGLVGVFAEGVAAETLLLTALEGLAAEAAGKVGGAVEVEALWGVKKVMGAPLVVYEGVPGVLVEAMSSKQYTTSPMPIYLRVIESSVSDFIRKVLFFLM